MCAELYVFFGSANLSLQWYMFEYGGEGLKVVWFKLKQPAYNGTQESLWSPSCSSCVTHTWSLTLVSELWEESLCLHYCQQKNGHKIRFREVAQVKKKGWVTRGREAMGDFFIGWQKGGGIPPKGAYVFTVLVNAPFLGHDQKRYRHLLDISLLCQTLFMSTNTDIIHLPPPDALPSLLLPLPSPPFPSLSSPPSPLLSLSGWWGGRQWSYLRLSSISLSAVGSIWSYTEAKRHQRDKKSSQECKLTFHHTSFTCAHRSASVLFNWWHWETMVHFTTEKGSTWFTK